MSTERHGARAAWLRGRPACGVARLCLFACLWLTLWSGAATAGVRAFLDRDTVTLGETVTLNVESDGQGGAEPDLSPLGASFRLLGTSSSTQISLVNGRQSARRLWAVALEPLVAGVLGIPALDVGGERTEPLTLTVLAAPQGATAAPGDDVFIEIEASPRDPYVQQQVLYTLRLHYAVALEGQLDEPQAPGLRVQRLGGDVRFQRRLGERRYEVIERRYALVPERSGAVGIAAPKFSGMASDGGLSGFMRSGRRIQVSGAAVDLDVKPKPAGGRDPWLPATSLTLEDESGALDGPFRVGEPLTVVLRLRAEGLSAEQLPTLQLPDVDGAQVYPDQESSQTRDAGERMLGERIRRFAIVPSRAGTLELPQVAIDWWDTQADQPAQAVVAARSIEVLPAAGQVASAPEGAAQLPGDLDLPELPTADAPWRWATLLFAGLWLATLALLLKRSGTRVTPASEPSAPTVDAPRELRRALERGRLDDIARALGRAVSPPAAGLDALADRIADARQSVAIRRLERRLYGPSAADGDDHALLAELRAVLANGLRPAADVDASGPEALPPLYAVGDGSRPERTRGRVAG